jgi:endonuclease/exonuclease/phosphatase family metal-dependent hydrolase
MSPGRAIFLLLLLLAPAWENPVSAAPGTGDPFSVMTFNIRYNNPADSIFSWNHRKDMVYRVIRKYHPSIMGLQEVLRGQADDIQSVLPAYRMAGTGRDDGKEAGEYSAIFYDTTRFAVISGSTFWLSETPSVPGSKSWGTACTRIVTHICLVDRETGRTWFVFNTHFDHISEDARQHSAELLLDSIRGIAGSCPVILTGDFNSGKESKTYRTLTSGIKYTLVDSGTTDPGDNSGPDCTFIGFPAKIEPGNVIDFIFTSPPEKFLLSGHRVIDDQEKGLYPSDHLPVMVTITDQTGKP